MKRPPGKSKASPGGRLTPQEERRRLEAYKSTRRDQEAAAKLGLKIMTFRLWRIRRGLKARGIGHNRLRWLPADEVEHRRRVLLQSRSVREAARRLHVDRFNLYRFMRNHKLPNPRRNFIDRQRDEWCRLVGDGRRVSDVARAYGVAVSTVSQAVRSAGGPDHRRRASRLT